MIRRPDSLSFRVRQSGGRARAWLWWQSEREAKWKELTITILNSPQAQIHETARRLRDAITARLDQASIAPVAEPSGTAAVAEPPRTAAIAQSPRPDAVAEPCRDHSMATLSQSDLTAAVANTAASMITKEGTPHRMFISAPAVDYPAEYRRKHDKEGKPFRMFVPVRDLGVHQTNRGGVYPSEDRLKSIPEAGAEFCQPR